MVAQLLLLPNKQPAANEKQTPQQRAVKNRAITFKCDKYPEVRNTTTTHTPTGAAIGYERGLLRAEWPIERAKEYFEECMEKYKVSFPMNVPSIYGVDINLIRAVDMTEEGRLKWVFYNKKPCLLVGVTTTAIGQNQSTYDFEELFEQGDM